MIHVICKYYPLISAQKPGNMFFQSYPISNRKSEKGSFRSGISEISSKMDHFEISGHLRVVAAAEVIYQATATALKWNHYWKPHVTTF